MAKAGYARRKKKSDFMTAEQLLVLKTDTFYELYDGVPRVREPGGEVHGCAEMDIAVALYNYVRSHRLGKVFPSSLGYVLQRNPDTVLAPDVSFVRNERIAYRVPSEEFFEGSPDLAVEVMFPTNSFPEMQRKAAPYLAAGTALVWIIRPRQHTAVVLRADGSSEVIPKHGVLDGEQVIPGFRFTLAELFAGTPTL